MPLPRDHLSGHSDPHRELERLAPSATPGLEVGVAQPGEPRVVRREAVRVLEEPEGDDEGRERVRDARVALVEDSQVRPVEVDAAEM